MKITKYFGQNMPLKLDTNGDLNWTHNRLREVRPLNVSGLMHSILFALISLELFVN